LPSHRLQSTTGLITPGCCLHAIACPLMNRSRLP
jgi:hypothetical protein